MTTIKAPYNFVPLNKKVFFPYWSDFVSQDIPFKNSLSGRIKLKIKAETPIFVRGEGEKSNFVDSNGKEFGFLKYHFFKLNNNYCIPGTSIKGEIANVLDILSFGKLKKINGDKVLSVRDMTYPNLLMGKANGCGFLSKKGQNYELSDCGKILPISYEEIFRAKGKDLSGESTIKDKYQLIDETEIKITKAEKEVELRNGNTRTITVAVYDDNGEDGKLVFSGDIIGKKNEFVFIERDRTIPVDDKVFNDFSEVYFSGDSDSGEYLKPKFESGKPIPVFYTKNDNEITALGLSQLFKVKYKHSVHDFLSSEHKKPDLDLVETIFGFVANDSQKQQFEDLKGRLSIEPALITTPVKELSFTIALGGPKATYYPFYLWQNPRPNDKISGNYKTFMSDSAELSGRKRYPIHEQLPAISQADPSKVTVSFCPLEKDAEFETTLHYHNLRPVELGAVLSALTFHNTEKCHHSLGMAKPLGFGNVKLSIDFNNSSIKREEDAVKYMGMFEALMTDFNDDWLHSEQLKELMSIATPISNDHPKINKLDYLKLEEFAKVKKEKKALQRYSKFMGVRTPVTSLSSNCDFILKDDKALFFIDKERPQRNIDEYTIQKKSNILQYIDKVIGEIKIEAKKTQEKQKSDKIHDFRKNGINFLLEQTSMDDLISKLNSWRGKFYEKEDQKKIREGKIPAIPQTCQKDFLAHIQFLFEQNPRSRVWKINKNKTKKFMVTCVGPKITEKWFKSNNIVL